MDKQALEAVGGVTVGALARGALRALVLALLLGGCSNGNNSAPYQGGPGDRDASLPVTSCAAPNTGCPCSDEGEAVDCGKVKEYVGDYVSCSMGTRTCTAGLWGACQAGNGETQTQSVRRPVGHYSFQSLGAPGTCPAGFNPCDPYCNQFVDTPTGVDAGPSFVNDAGANDAGLTPSGGVQLGCDSLAITASSGTATVTQISPVVSSAVSLIAKLSPVGCLASPFATSWTIDRFDIGSIGGTNNSNGSLQVVSPIVGTITVTAYAAGLSATTAINVKVNALDTSSTAIAPNTVSTNIAKFGTATAPLAGTVASTVNWLYPYASTYLPLGLPAPVVQYWSSTSNIGADVKVTLRYPSGSTASTASFNYALIAKEANKVSQTVGVAANTLDPQLVIPQVAWQAFAQTARGGNADLTIQRYVGTKLEYESPRTIHFVNGQLKGTVYYNSYSSPQGGNTGAVLSIAPGATTPKLAVQPNGQCTVCHSLNLDGSVLIVNGRLTNSGEQFNQSHRFNLTSGAAPYPSVLNSYAYSGAGDQDLQGDRFTYGAPWKDGSLYMTDGANSASPAYGDHNWRSPPDYSRLYNPAASSFSSSIPVTGWTNITATTPRFSPDGTLLAFGFWGSNVSTLAQSPSGSLLADPSGRTLVVVSFSGSPTSASVSNARNLTPGVTQAVAWPSFTPLGDQVLYQRQYRTSQSKQLQCTKGNHMNCLNNSDCESGNCNRLAALCVCSANTDCDSGTQGGCATCTSGANCGTLNSGWSPSDINTVAGALSEIWMSNVPANKNTAATPTRLLQLNGLNSVGTSALPTDTLRVASPPSPSYHSANASFGITQPDGCGNTGTATNVNDYQLNYLPAVNPTDAGGENWVVFTSRRMYGNIATNDPWDAEPNQSCYSGVPATKKLWVAALDENPAPGTDPSHPAFYLPGQELQAGNSNGYWVNSQCLAVNTACSTNDDCCGGTGASPTVRCDGVSKTCKAYTACLAVGTACTQTTDCCTGLICGGTGVCLNPTYFTTATYQREYVATCASDSSPSWQLFEWQATIPASTSIAVGVQTKTLVTDAYAPTAPLSIASITASTATGAWGQAPTTVKQVLDNASIASTNSYLLVSMTFNPNANGTAAPTLGSWRLEYDCVPSQ